MAKRRNDRKQVRKQEAQERVERHEAETDGLRAERQAEQIERYQANRNPYAWS